MSLIVTTEQRRRLIEAVVWSYAGPAELAGGIYASTGRRIGDELDLHRGFKAVVSDAVSLSEGQGWLEVLVRAAMRGAPYSETLQNIAVELDLVALPTPKLPAAPVAADSAALQDVIRKRRPPILLQLFSERLQAVSRAVCWIGLRDATMENPQLGSGFLVGPDLVLTNYHVIADLLRGDMEPGAVVFRFQSAQGEAVTSIGLAAEWCLDQSTAAASDTAVGGAAPGADQLDYALVRLQGAAGPAWLRLDQEPPPLITEDFVFVVQHPAETMDGADGAQRIAVGLVLGFEGTDGCRIRYDASTTPGSSGSPVFTADLQLAALHHGTEPLLDTEGRQVAFVRVFNRGIPLRPIVVRLRKNGFGALIGVQV